MSKSQSENIVDDCFFASLSFLNSKNLLQALQFVTPPLPIIFGVSFYHFATGTLITSSTVKVFSKQTCNGDMDNTRPQLSSGGMNEK